MPIKQEKETSPVAQKSAAGAGFSPIRPASRGAAHAQLASSTLLANTHEPYSPNPVSYCLFILVTFWQYNFDILSSA